MTPTITLGSLPAPWIIPHRGGANLLPEETLDAYRAAVNLSPFVDVDLWSLHGGGLGVMHDSTMDRTTCGHGSVNEHAPHQFVSQLVTAADFYGPYPATQYPLLLDDLFKQFGASVIYTPEVKAPTTDPDAGPRLLALIQAYGLEANCIVQADDLNTLAPFVSAGIACCLGSVSSDTVAASFPASALISAGVGYVSVSKACSDATFVNYAKGGISVLAWTVDRHTERDRLMGLSNPPVGYFTNEPGYLNPATALYQRTTDWYQGYRWDHGMMLSATRSDRWDITLSGTPTNGINGYLDSGVGPQVWQMLQGYLCPITASSYTLTFSVRAPSAWTGDGSRWASLFLATSDMDWTDPGSATLPGVNGYNCIVRQNGGLTIYRIDNGAGTQVANHTGAAAWPTDTWQQYQITVTPTQVTLAHLSTVDTASISTSDTTYRGLGYCWANFNINAGQQIQLGGISVT